MFLSSLWTLWSQNYWRDEVFRIFMAKHSLVEIVQLTYGDGQPPLYYYALKVWMMIFGDGEIVTRAFSLIAFEILVFLLLYFSRLLQPKNKMFSVSVLLLTLFNGSLVVYAFEARMYLWFILLVFLANLSLYQKKYLPWVIFTVLGLYTHNFMVFVLLANLFWLFLDKNLNKTVLKSLFVIGVLYLPWVGVFLNQARLIIHEFWVQPFSREIFFSSLAGIYFAYDNYPQELRKIFTILTLIISLSVILAPKNSFWKFNVVSLVIPLVTVILISLFIRPIFLARYLSFLTVPLIFLVALFIAQKSLVRSLCLLFFAITTSLYVYQLMFPYRLKPDIRSKIIGVVGLIKEGDAIYTTPLNYFETQYYFAKLAPISYTKTIPIKVFYPTPLPFYVGKVLIKDENITNQIPANQRIFAIGENNQITIFSK